jgi:ABC-type sugar transport system substrate-binding protein
MHGLWHTLTSSAKRTVALAIPAASVLALAACGSSSTSTKTTSAAAAKRTAQTAVANQSPTKLSNQAMQGMMSLGGPVRWEGANSGPPPQKGKSVAIMPCSLQIQVCQYIAKQFKEAASAAGFEPKVIDGQSDPTKEQAGVDVALNQGIDCLITMAAPVRDVAPQAKRMRAQHIPIVEAFAGQDGDVVVGVNQRNAGAALASYVLTHGGGNIIVTNTPQLPELTLRTNGFVDYINKFGKGKAKIVGRGDFTLQELGPGQEAKTKALIARYPNATWLYTPSDAVAYAPLDTAKQEGHPLKGRGFDGPSRRPQQGPRHDRDRRLGSRLGRMVGRRRMQPGDAGPAGRREQGPVHSGL